jgi:ATP:cob(I)alamin adenosyltransferase
MIDWEYDDKGKLEFAYFESNNLGDQADRVLTYRFKKNIKLILLEALSFCKPEAGDKPQLQPAPKVPLLFIADRSIQNELFDLGADLSNPLNEHYEYEPLRVDSAWIDALEEAIDYYNSKLEKLDSFIIPGGSGVAAGLHLARTVVRRAERATWHAIEEHGTEPAKKGHKDGGVSILAVKYLNRLSDLLFVLARYANINHGGDVKWVPAANRREAPAKRRPEQD